MITLDELESVLPIKETLLGSYTVSQIVTNSFQTIECGTATYKITLTNNIATNGWMLNLYQSNGDKLFTRLLPSTNSTNLFHNYIKDFQLYFSVDSMSLNFYRLSE